MAEVTPDEVPEGVSESEEAVEAEDTAETSEQEEPTESTAPGVKVQSIEGIGPKYAEALNGQGIATTQDLLSACADPKDRKALSEKIKVSPKRVLTWVNHADLMRIKGVGGEYAELLEAAGVDTVPELATRNPTNLHAKIAEVNEAKKLTRRIPSQKSVESWVAEAKDLPRVVNY